MEREQFTFYSSFAKAARRIRKPADRCAFYDAVVSFALTGQEPDLDNAPESVALAMELVMPVLISSRRKAENGKAKGSKAEANGSKPEANESKPEANPEQEQTGNKKEKEGEKEGKKEKENECYLSPPAPSPEKKPVAHVRSANGWVKLTDEQFARLRQELGAEELSRCIGYVDELAQSSGNKNGWKDWNMVIRRCSREGWGRRGEQKRSPAYATSKAQQPLTADQWDDVLKKI